MTEETIDIAIIGAGAAGMTAGIFAGREASVARPAGQGSHEKLKIVLFDGAKKPGAKILVSGGGRCNVTNQAVSEKDFFGGSPNIIRNVLRQFDNRRVLEWMAELGVELKLEEERGKYFPVTDQARTVLDALKRELTGVGVETRPGLRIRAIEQLHPADDESPRFRLQIQDGQPILVRRLVLATGGRALPKSGSDGWGLDQARRLGHDIIETSPALVPLTVEQESETGRLLNQFSGTAARWRSAVENSASKVLYEREESVLMTHFGLSGPGILDVSRHLLREGIDSREARFILRLPMLNNLAAAMEWLRAEAKANPRKNISSVLREYLPREFTQSFIGQDRPMAELSKEMMQHLARKTGAWEIPVNGSRGYSFAETTAGGVCLSNVNWRSMESRKASHLYFCGEILDVDGRLGGFNFQWAWSSGYIAGTNTVQSLLQKT